MSSIAKTIEDHSNTPRRKGDPHPLHDYLEHLKGKKVRLLHDYIDPYHYEHTKHGAAVDHPRHQHIADDGHECYGELLNKVLYKAGTIMEVAQIARDGYMTLHTGSVRPQDGAKVAITLEANQVELA